LALEKGKTLNLKEEEPFMKALFAVVLLLAASGTAFAEGPCENFAKYGAIRAYKLEAGPQLGEMTFAAKLMRGKGDKALYHVKISDVPENGQAAYAQYFVTIQAMEASCKVLDVVQTDLDGAF
jgi:hypothetical protein